MDNNPADYALNADGCVLGVVEAKRLRPGPQNALTQAERNARGPTANLMDYGGFRVPFLYSPNGDVIWFRDVRFFRSQSHKLERFYGP